MPKTHLQRNTHHQDDLPSRMIEEIEDYAIILLDPEGIIQNWNKGAEKIKGYQADEIVGKNFRIFYGEEDRKSGLPDRLLQDAAANGKARHEGWRIKKDGSKFWGSIVITAVHDAQGNIIGFTKVTRDLTRRKLAEEERDRQAQYLLQKNEELRRSEERFYKMVDEVQDYAIILLDPDGNIRNWNKGAENIKGYKRQDVIGKNFRVFYTPEDRERGLPEKLLNEAIQTGRANHEGWRVRKDGTKFWGNIVITALHDQHNHIIGFTKVTRDLTERKLAEEEKERQEQIQHQKNEQLRQSEERYHKMVDEVQDYAILLLDKEGNILNWNAGAQKIKGYTANEIIGKNFSTFYFPEDRAAGLADKLLKTAADTGRAVHEGWRMRKDGSRFWGSVVITALHNEQDEIIGFSKVTRDLTDKKLAEDRLIAYATELERKNEELAEFAYVASHDLKEPLRKILVYGDYVYEDYKNSADEKLVTYVTRMRESAYRMMTLIEDLLRFSRIENEQEEPTPVNLNAVISDVLRDLEPAIQQKNVQVNIDELPTIKARPSQLRQLFQNLIGNAVKFNDKAVPQISITNDEAPDEEMCRIIVRDNGIGFSNEYKNQIFEIFQRLHGRGSYGGSGIGLAICKKIVEFHHGRIEAFGEEGSGARFELTLPC